MKIKKNLSRLGILLLVLAVLFGGYTYYNKNISPTKVAFINYQEFQLSRIKKSTPNSWIQIDQLGMDELEKARDYSAIFIFGRGFQMSPEQMQLLQNAGYAGVNLFVEAATNPNVDVTNLQGADLDYITDYFNYGGTRNYANLLTYVRQKMDAKTWFVSEPLEPLAIARDVFIHLEESAIFEDFNTYEKYLKENGSLKEGQAKIALLTSVPGPFNANREHIDDLIKMLEKRNLNVFTISAATKRLEFLKQVDPDLVILMPHGRLTLGQDKEAKAWLEEKNIPVFNPLSVFQPYEDWVDDPQGFAGPLLSMSVVLPELDGGINPYAIIAQYEDEMGYLSFQVIPDRLEKFGDMVEQWLTLKKKNNADKKIAIYYFKGPGLNAMVAANMEVVPSIYNTLVQLKKEGYKVDNLPASADELWEMIKQQGSVLGPYAKGAFDEFLKMGNPELVDVDTYKKWVENDLETESYEAVVDKFGEAPGEYLVSRQQDKDYLAVARLQFGNVVLLPQPLAGLGENTFQIVHGTKTAPPHPYIASYLWTRNEFQADAIFHWGTHGSLEFTPGKQVALSNYDWTDALIGTTPHFYIYTISNVGEGVIAKRRSYASTLSYLTPPFMESDLTGELKELSDKLVAFVGAKGAVREQYRKNISQLAVQLSLDVDLGLDSTATNYDDAAIQQISNQVELVRNAKVSSGLYSMGKSYTTEQTNNTVTLMSVDPIAYSLAALDKLNAKVSQEQLDNQIFFDKKYRQKALQLIDKIINKGTSVEKVLATVITQENIKQAYDWKKKTQGMSDADIVRGFIGMADNKPKKNAPSTSHKKQDTGLSEDELKELKRLVIAISPFPERVDFIQNLKSEKRFKESSGLLDPQTLEKAKVIAKAIPAMAKAIEVGQQAEVFALLKMMQKEPIRQRTFELLDDDGLAEQVAAEKRRAEEAAITELTQTAYIDALSLVQQPKKMNQFTADQLKKYKAQLKKYAANWSLMADKKPAALNTFLQTTDFANQLKKTIDEVDLQLLAMEKKEAEVSTAVLNIEQTIRSVNQYRTNLRNSTEGEMQAVLTALKGGFISPSPGGDPITNPATVPTGRNLYSIDAEKTPSPEAWDVGKTLAQTLLKTHFDKHGAYPKKVSFTLWPGDFIDTEGAMVAQIFYLLGVEPVRDPFKRVVDIRLIPQAELGRPRIDVVTQTAGQFRDLAASRMYLINKAVKMAAAANDSEDNFVKNGVLAAELYMKDQGLSPKQARAWSTQRVFGGVNGIYGTNIMGMVEKGDAWENEEEIAATYLNNMGAIYDEGDNWGAFQAGVFEAALQNTEVVVQPRESNTWGGLSLDHVYEFMGGLSMAVRSVTGKDPDAYFNDFRNPTKATVQGLKEALWVEARSTLLNPKYIKEYMKGGATSAETFAETFRNTYGWNVMKPAEIDDALWNDLHEVYVQDKLNLEVHDFFQRENPYALQEMTAVMLETVRKGYWEATPEQVKEMADLHAQLVGEYKAGCSGFVCDNQPLKDFINDNIKQAIKQDYNAAIANAREVNQEQIADNLVMEKETLKEKTKQAKTNQGINKVWFIGGISLMSIFLIFFIRRRRKEI